MSERTKAVLLLALAGLLAATVFWIDSNADYNFSIAILYLAVLVLVSAAAGAKAVGRAALGCVALTMLAWTIAHLREPTLESALRCLFAGVVISVTAALLISRKRLETAKQDIERSRHEVDLFANSVPYVLWRSNPQGEIVYLNESWTAVTGLDRWSVLPNAGYNDVVHPDDIPILNETVSRAVSTQTVTDLKVRIRQADGAYRWMQIYDRPAPSPLTGEIERYGGLSDVHNEVTAKEELQRIRIELETSKAELEAFTNSVPQILWRTGTDGRIDFFNRRYTEITGRDYRDAIEHQDYIEHFHPEDRDEFLRLLREAFSTRTELRATYRLRHSGGEFRWMSLVGRPVQIADGSNDIRFYGGITDIHEEVIAHQKVQELNETLEQRVAERTSELVRTELRYSSLFDVSNMTFAEMDFSGADRVLEEIKAGGVTDLRAYMNEHPDQLARALAAIQTTRVNEALARMMGYEDVADLLANPPAQNAEDGVEVLLRQLEMSYYGITHIDGRTVLSGKDGRRIPVYFTVMRLQDGLHLSSHLDLSEQERIEEIRRATQAELARANRVAAVGAMSASIAHELNQPIVSMLIDATTGLRLLGRETPDLETLTRILQRVDKTAKRVSSIVQRTRDSIVAGRRSAEPIDLCRFASDTRDLLEHELKRASVELEIICPDAIPTIECDPVALQQVFVNLVSNAIDAMRDQPGTRRIKLEIAPDDETVRVRFTDNGPGIPAEHIGRLFEPFFTTKSTGIGMGLQICRTAVEAMGGQLTVSNQPGAGASFLFDLPMTSTDTAGLEPA